jgi:hypothetical protein
MIIIMLSRIQETIYDREVIVQPDVFLETLTLFKSYFEQLSNSIILNGGKIIMNYSEDNCVPCFGAGFK